MSRRYLHLPSLPLFLTTASQKRGKMKSHAKQLSHSVPACTFLSEELLEAQFRGGEFLLHSVEVEST